MGKNINSFLRYKYFKCSWFNFLAMWHTLRSALRALRASKVSLRKNSSHVIFRIEKLLKQKTSVENISEASHRFVQAWEEKLWEKFCKMHCVAPFYRNLLFFVLLLSKIASSHILQHNWSIRKYSAHYRGKEKFGIRRRFMSIGSEGESTKVQANYR